MLNGGRLECMNPRMGEGEDASMEECMYASMGECFNP